MILERDALFPFLGTSSPSSKNHVGMMDVCVCGFKPPPKFFLKVILLLGQYSGTLGKGGQLGKLQKSEPHSWKDLERSRYPIPESEASSAYQ